MLKSITRRMMLGLAAVATTGMGVSALAADMPKQLDNPGDVKIALVRYLSTGDFFQPICPALNVRLRRWA